MNSLSSPRVVVSSFYCSWRLGTLAVALVAQVQRRATAATAIAAQRARLTYPTLTLKLEVMA